MAERLTEKNVRDIAAYAHIGLNDDEIARMTVDLNNIIATLEPIGGLHNVMREDVVEESFTQEQALANAPHRQDGSFLIPAILGGGDQ